MIAYFISAFLRLPTKSTKKKKYLSLKKTILWEYSPIIFELVQGYKPGKNGADTSTPSLMNERSVVQIKLTLELL